jgi:TonB family protein
LIIGLVFLVLPFSCFPQSDAIPSVGKSSAPIPIDISKLIVTYSPDANLYYPLFSKRSGEQGEVAVRLIIDETGGVEDVVTLRSSTFPRLDRAATEIGRRYRFKPFLVNGSPARISTNLSVRFNLKEPESLNSSAASQAPLDPTMKAGFSALWILSVNETIFVSHSKFCDQIGSPIPKYKAAYESENASIIFAAYKVIKGGSKIPLTDIDIQKILDKSASKRENAIKEQIKKEGVSEVQYCESLNSNSQAMIQGKGLAELYPNDFNDVMNSSHVK